MYISSWNLWMYFYLCLQLGAWSSYEPAALVKARKCAFPPPFFPKSASQDFLLFLGCVQSPSIMFFFSLQACPWSLDSTNLSVICIILKSCAAEVLCLEGSLWLGEGIKSVGLCQAVLPWRGPWLCRWDFHRRNLNQKLFHLIFDVS